MESSATEESDRATSAETNSIHSLESQESPELQLTASLSSSSSSSSCSPDSTPTLGESSSSPPLSPNQIQVMADINPSYVSSAAVISDTHNVVPDSFPFDSNREESIELSEMEQSSPDQNAAPCTRPRITPGRVLPNSITIMNEYGQETDKIDFENNNNNNNIELIETVDAVSVRNVTFSYTSSESVLSNISLAVPKGKIYALLGSSGGGKTTLLRIILGQLRARKGEVRVFNAQPGSIRSNIPGSGVGYMPQHLALFPTFSIEETFYYFGMLHHMNKLDIRKKTDFFVDFLNLPPKDRLIDECSGGQQRRASLATTLLHSPPLLILDEPTVGVDPLLRCKIWQYLEYLCSQQAMTVIITTHYIEESRNASNLAFMRFGRILTQDSPTNLLESHECTVLEDVFLKLCQQDCGEIKKKYSTKRTAKHAKKPAVEEKMAPIIKSRLHGVSVDGTRLRALFFKNVLNLKRNPLIFVFYLILPVVQISLFCSSVLKTPNNLPVAVYTGESRGLSKRFISLLDTDTLKVKTFHTEKEAIQSVVEGKAWYAISMDSNFTRAYRKRAKRPMDLEDEDIESSKIKLYADTTDSFIGLTVHNSMLHSYQQFVEYVAQSFGYNAATVRLPVKVEEIVYGYYNTKQGFDVLNNLAPSVVVAIIYTTPLILAAMLIVLERKGGTIERTIVSGATSLEILVSHLLSMMAILVFQVALLMVVTFMVFEIRLLGSALEAFFLIYMCGLCGMLIGFLISCVSPNPTVAFLSSLGMIFPIWMMCGVFWPLESLNPRLQEIFWLVPLSYPIRSIQLITRRGWTIENAEVQLGYYISAFYNSVMLVATIVIFNITSK